VIGNAVKVMRVATGEETEELETDQVKSAAAELGSRGGKRVARLSKKQTMRPAVIIVLSLFQCSVLFRHDLAAQTESKAAVTLAECGRFLRAALLREYIWSDPPTAYDRNGDPAIAIKFVADASGKGGDLNAIEAATLAIVKNTECVVSRGEWTNRPINIVERKGYALGRYDGENFENLDMTANISIPTCEKYGINCLH
jgi:hypothetical protein